MTFEEMQKNAKDFYDTIDFTKFMNSNSNRIEVRSLMDCLEEYYDSDNP